MNEEFRTRVFQPVVIPIGVVLVILAVVGVFALILLYNTRLTAVLLAILMAGGILFSISLAASRDRLSGTERLAVIGAGAAPAIIGGLIALGLGGIPAEELNINREPHQVVPENAPVIGAINSLWFCNPLNGECAETHEVRLPANQATTLVFDNRDSVVHNWTMTPSEDSDEVIAATPDGSATQLIAEVPAQDPGEYFFVCTIHPNMTGTVVVSEDITEATVNGGG